MPQNCLQDLIRLLYFVDDWEIEEDENWDDNMFNYPKYDNHDDADTAPHRVKFWIIETEYVKRWQQCVKFGLWITADEPRLDGWYHSGITIHSLFVTRGKLMLYKLHDQTNGGVSDGDIQGRHKHTQNEAKFINLFDMNDAIQFLWERSSCYMWLGLHGGKYGTGALENMEDQYGWSDSSQSIGCTNGHIPQIGNPTKKQTYEYKIKCGNTKIQ